MDQRIQYVTTPDGMRIAYSVMGSGPPMAHIIGWPFAHLKAELTVPPLARYYEVLTSAGTLIRADMRGTGMSQRGTLGEPDRGNLDIEQALMAVGQFPILLTGYGQSGGRAAVAFTLRHPERVARLVLWDVPVKSPLVAPQLAAMSALATADWEAYTETLARFVYGWTDVEASTMAVFLRAAITPEDFARALDYDFAPIEGFSQLRLPTLVLQHEASKLFGAEDGSVIAAQIPGAVLDTLEGPWINSLERADIAANKVLDFFGLSPSARAAAAPHDRVESGALRTVLFTDIVGHTEMMQRLGDARGRDILREHERITRETLARHGGAEVKTMGDGFMASFGSVTAAVECAIALQRAFAAFALPAPLDRESLGVRCGLNAGEPIQEDGDLFGATVILASRIAAKASAGEILIPEPVRHLLSGKSFVFGDRGEFALKGFDDAVRLYEVRWEA